MSSERILYIHTKKRGQKAWLLVSKRKPDTHANPKQNTGNARRKPSGTKQKDGGRARNTFFFLPSADRKMQSGHRENKKQRREEKRREGKEEHQIPFVRSRNPLIPFLFGPAPKSKHKNTIARRFQCNKVMFLFCLEVIPLPVHSYPTWCHPPSWVGRHISYIFPASRDERDRGIPQGFKAGLNRDCFVV